MTTQSSMRRSPDRGNPSKVGTRWRTDLSPRARRQILELGKLLAPQEACGLLLPPDYVVQLPNRAKARLRTESYEVRESDVVEAVERWLEDEPGAQSQLEDFEFVVWHTHPAGGVGPSRKDMQAKRELYPEQDGRRARVRFLVISLPWGEAAFF